MDSLQCVNEHANAQRIIDWILDPNHKPANLAFTEGPERQVAYAVGLAKQEWNKRCNDACEKQVLKQVNAAYEQAAVIAEEVGTIYFADHCFSIAKQIRGFKTNHENIDDR